MVWYDTSGNEPKNIISSDYVLLYSGTVLLCSGSAAFGMLVLYCCTLYVVCVYCAAVLRYCVLQLCIVQYFVGALSILEFCVCECVKKTKKATFCLLYTRLHYFNTLNPRISE